MKTCIWCSKDETTAKFHHMAHTFPESMGGRNICVNVCDNCNSFFGSPQSRSPAIEVVFKEVLNVSRYILLNEFKRLPINERYKSEYFNLNLKDRKLSIKPRFMIRTDFQEKLGRLFRRAIYKVYLEERERQKGDSLDQRFDFIRAFARYNIGEFPIFYINPKFDFIVASVDDVLRPTLRFTPYSDELDQEFRIFEYHFLGHYFCIPTSSEFLTLCFNRYKQFLINTNHAIGFDLRQIGYVTDLDFTFKKVSDN